MEKICTKGKGAMAEKIGAMEKKMGAMEEEFVQQQMGAMAGVSRQTISQIERGDYSPSVTLALKLAKLCGVTVEDIFTYKEGPDHEDP